VSEICSLSTVLTSFRVRRRHFVSAEFLLSVDTFSVNNIAGQVPSVHKTANCRFMAGVIDALLIDFRQCLHGAQQSANETNHMCGHYSIKIESINAY
jgi:hypothetical protein